MDDKKQSSVISDQSSDQTESVTQAEKQETIQSEETPKKDSEGRLPPNAASSRLRRKSERTRGDEPQGAVPPQRDVVSEQESGAANQNDELNKLTDSSATDESTTTEESQKPDEPAPSDEPASPAKKDNPNAKWYVVHTYSGHENKVAHTLKQRIESEHLENKILDVLVPMQDKIEIKGGKKINVKEKIFPGYILVKMVLDDVSWLAIRTTQGVTSFVGMGNKPTPISDAEVATIVKFTQTEAPLYKQIFMPNDTVKIIDGPFADFIGKVDNVDEERGKVKVLVSIFGRETPVELDFLQVQKI